MKRLVRQGVLVQAQDQWYVADTVAEDTDTSALRPLQHAQLFTALPLAPRAGRKVLTLREAMPIDTETDYEAKDPMARWHHASSDVAVGVYAKARGAGAKTTPSLNPISWSAGTECEVALKGSAAGVK